MTKLKWTDCSSNWWMSANRRLQEAPRHLPSIIMFGFLFLKSSDSGLKVKRSSWKMDTKTNVDSQTTLKLHNNMHKVILYDQLLLQKFIHNFLLGEMQIIFFLFSKDYGRALTDREEQTAASWNHNPQLSAACEPRFFWHILDCGHMHSLALTLLKQLVFLFGLCRFGAPERWTLQLLLWYRHQRG